MTQNYPKRLIEVDLPIARISAHARREKSIRHGHISTLHIWWARRPLAACRAVICAALWPDPADVTQADVDRAAADGRQLQLNTCPPAFRQAAVKLLVEFAKRVYPTRINEEGKLLQDNASPESLARWEAIAKATMTLDPDDPAEGWMVRLCLLDFIADFANWDNSTVPAYLETSRALTQAAHEALGGAPGTRPLVVDPFAGGGSIPLESLRIGADALGSDYNPLPVLLNKVALEYLPKYGDRLADGVRKWGEWIKQEATRELAKYYPRDEDGSTPIAYLWARTIKCEGPGCGAEIPLIGRSIIAKRKNGNIGIALRSEHKRNAVSVHIVEGRQAQNTTATCKGFVATCPREACQFSTPKKSVQRQLTTQRGGADTSRLIAVLTDGPKGRCYRLGTAEDNAAIEAARKSLSKADNALVPDEPIPNKTAHRAVGSQLPLYGFTTWGDLFTTRQKLAIIVLQKLARRAYLQLLELGDEHLARAVFLLLAFAVDKQADYLSSLCRWVSGGEFIAGTLAGEKKFPMMSDFAEANPVGNGSGCWNNQLDWICRFIDREAGTFKHSGTALKASADERTLPSDSAAAMITDPPYYDSVPYADLSDFYYVWLRRTLAGIEQLPDLGLTPKERQMTVDHPGNEQEKLRYEALLTGAFENGRDVTAPSGIAVIVFAHKSTSGWETLVEAIIKSGWIVTASWPIDTERAVRLNALDTASLASSVHIICRPREDADGIVRGDAVGEWRDVLSEMPQRIHEWMPRLAAEGVVGADAIFACLGPALEIFSRYSRVEKANGDTAALREYLEHVWAAVSTEALSLIFKDANAAGLEPDARLTAMWLWTIGGGGRNGNEKKTNTEEDGQNAEHVTEGEEASPDAGGKGKAAAGFSLEYDAARKIAQGLGVHLEQCDSLVEVKGDKARLLPVAERTTYLFGKGSQAGTASPGRKKKVQQKKLFTEFDDAEATEAGWTGLKGPPPGATVLDRVHQSMILFAANRGELLKRFLVEDGVGKDDRFWKLADNLNKLYPPGTEERRWIEGVLARKKGLGL